MDPQQRQCVCDPSFAFDEHGMSYVRVAAIPTQLLSLLGCTEGICRAYGITFLLMFSGMLAYIVIVLVALFVLHSRNFFEVAKVAGYSTALFCLCKCHPEMS